MVTPSDPAWHQQREKELFAHFTTLLADKRMQIDTRSGKRAVTSATQSVKQSDRSVEIRRKMNELNVFDRALSNALPAGLSMDVSLTGTRFWFFRSTLGQVRLVSAPPTNDLIQGKPPAPLTDGEVRYLLQTLPPPLPGVPLTTILFSSSGYTREAAMLAGRSENRTLILIETNPVGGWTSHGPADLKDTLDLLNPEKEAEKLKRVEAAVEEAEFELMQAGVSAEKLAERLHMPVDKVEASLEQLAKTRVGLAAKRFDGKLVLYRESRVTPGLAGGSSMPLFDKIKNIFGKSDDTKEKIAFLAERRTAIAQQQDVIQKEMGALEEREAKLKEQFKTNESAVIRKRVTTQMVELRKEIDRKVQLMTMLNQQANVVAAHLHSLELVQQGNSIKLPDNDTMAEDAAKAEEILAGLQADSEMADELSGSNSSSMSDAEREMFEELMKETGQAKESEPATGAKTKSKTSESEPAVEDVLFQPTAPAKKKEAQAG
jgi:hypothetical protein